MSSIWERSIWPEEIYRLQVSDPVQGGQDGVTNVPPTQVANRTRWLKDAFELEHNEDGTHNLYNSSFSDHAAIVESKLALDVPTRTLKDRVEAAHTYAMGLRGYFDQIMGSDGFYLQGIAKLAQLNWRYSDFGFEFEFFVDELSMRDLNNVDTRGAIAYDDSLDCENTVGITPGMRLLLSDDKVTEEVEVWKVLEHGRLRLTKDLEHTFSNPAQLGYTNWDLSIGKAIAGQGGVFYSRVTTVLDEAPTGRLLICRDAGDGNLEVAYRVSGISDEWVLARKTGIYPAQNYDGYIYEEYEVQGGKVQLRITGIDTNVEVRHMALFSSPSQQVVQSIRTPEFAMPVDGDTCARDRMRMNTTGFFTAYDDNFVETEYRFMKPNTETVVASFVRNTLQDMNYLDENKMPQEGVYELVCRHKNDIGEYSQWSKPITVVLRNIEWSFGFEGNEKAGGFNDAKFASLKDADVAKFGFLGADGAAGFCIAPFTSDF